MNKIIGITNADFKSKTAVCLGNFDGLHIGHKRIIEILKKEAKAENIPETVIFTLYPHPLKFFGQDLQLLSTPRKREKLFEETGIDNIVTANFNDTLANLSPVEFFKKIIVDKLNAALIVVGKDYHFGANRKGDISLMAELGKEYGVKCIFLDKITDENGEEISSSRIRFLIKKGNVASAAKFLDRPYSLEGIVIHGDGRGKQFGFPTINLDVHNELIPALGIYATKNMIKEKIYDSMTYIGKRPTLKVGTETRVETNVFNFDEDIYGEFTEVYFYQFVRGDAKFSGIEALKKQMALDMVSVKDILKKIGDNK